MPDLYVFTGAAVTGYMAYRDVATGTMLVAEPGQAYQIAGVNLEDPVPPPDGRWEPAAPPVKAPSPATATAPPELTADPPADPAE